jgi:hypothetical protein
MAGGGEWPRGPLEVDGRLGACGAEEAAHGARIPALAERSGYMMYNMYDVVNGGSIYDKAIRSGTDGEERRETSRRQRTPSMV